MMESTPFAVAAREMLRHLPSATSSQAALLLLIENTVGAHRREIERRCAPTEPRQQTEQKHGRSDIISQLADDLAKQDGHAERAPDRTESAAVACKVAAQPAASARVRIKAHLKTSLSVVVRPTCATRRTHRKSRPAVNYPAPVLQVEP